MTEPTNAGAEHDSAVLAWVCAALNGDPVSHFGASFQIVRMAMDQRAALAALEAENARLRAALEWLVNLGHGVGRNGGVADGEIEDALDAGKALLAGSGTGEGE